MPGTTDSSANDEQREFRIAIIGLPAFERQVLTRIFVLSGVRPCKYTLCEPNDYTNVDLYLVEADSSDAMQAWQQRRAAESSRRIAGVFVAKNQPPSGHFLRRPLVASRVLNMLDSVVNQELMGTPPGPASATATGRETGPSARPVQPTPSPQSGYRALVVDDSLAVRKQVSIALSRQGMEADLAASGPEALELINRRSYDIVLLDVVMPGMDGYAVCREIKRNRERKHIPVVMLTGKTSPFDKVKGRLSGCDTYLTKPVKLSLFKQTLERLLPHAVQPD